MSFESLTNRGEYLSAHYLAEILPTTLKSSDLVKGWIATEKAGEETPAPVCGVCADPTSTPRPSWPTRSSSTRSGCANCTRNC